MSVQSTEGAAPVTAPAAPAPAAPAAAPTPTSVPTFTPAGAPTGGPVFTAEDIENARKQEKDKLYDSMETMKSELAALRKKQEDELAAREAEKQRLLDEAAAAAKAKEEEELSVRELLERKEAEWAAQLAAEREAREQQAEILRLEQELNVLQQYRSERIAQESENILPELIDLIPVGPSAEKIEEVITQLKSKSEAILQMAATAGQQARAAMPGVSVTAPSLGPAEINSENQTLSLADLKAMSMEDYLKNRDKLLPAASALRRTNAGLFG